MIKKIIYFVESQFCKRDYRRFGIEILLKRGYEVEVWDFSPYLRPNYYNNYTPPDKLYYDDHIFIYNRDEAIDFLSQLTSKDIVLCIMGITEKNMFIYDALSKNKIKYGFQLLGLLPKIKFNNTMTNKVIMDQEYIYLQKKLSIIARRENDLLKMT